MTILVEPRIQIEPTRRRINVDEYYAMAEAGILGTDERVELIDGEIITMAPIGDEHRASVDTGNHFLSRFVGDKAIVSVQSHVRLDDHHHPEPDLMLLEWREDFYRYTPPGPEEVLLLIEVSDSSLSYDRNVKLPLYAQFNIPEVWIANISDRVVETYTHPVNGRYTAFRTYSPGEVVSPGAFDDVEIPVSRFIGAMSDKREDNRPASG
ncbi:MAG: Uma2 family endonuclease [Dehalococcoidia bacterium]|nr:Uma2 family endonuclease [Dehalococcoidia bacterium]